MDVQLSIESYLLGCGFTTDLKSGSDGGRVFHGMLARAGIDPIKVRIWIYDWSLATYPSIFIEKGERHYKTNIAHINYDGSLCYVAQGEMVLNSSAPENAIERCLEAAAKLVARLDANDPTLLTDYQNEFDAYWTHSNIEYIPPFLLRLFACDGLSNHHYFLWFDRDKASSIWVVPIGKKPIDLAYLKFSNIEKIAPIGEAFVIHVNEFWPKCANSFLPNNMEELLEWLRVNSPTTLRKFVALTGSHELWAGSLTTVIFKLANCALGVTFLVNLDLKSIESIKIPGKELHRYGGLALYGKNNPLSKASLIRFYVENAGEEAIFSRNGNPSLQGKDILVIGCGAIGGFLVDSLCMVGAGLSGGSITIVDKEILETGNLTRHTLGMDDLNSSKSDAVKAKTNRDMPHVNIKSFPEDARFHLNFDYDLIIDATGLEALSRWVNREHLHHLREGGDTPILYAWLEGEGTAWRTFLVDSLDAHACWECLYIHGEDGDRALRFPHSDEPVNYRHVGCKTIVPYAATAAMQAAALGCEAAVDWCQGQPSPRFRGGHRSGRVYGAFTDRDLEKQEGCPACSRT